MVAPYLHKEELIRSLRLSPLASIITDPHLPDNPIMAVNVAFEQLTGYAEAELIGRNCRILAGPETSRERSAALRHAVGTATPALVELVNYRRDGSSFLNAVMVAPLFDDEGRLRYFVGSQMEVTEQPGGARAVAAERVAGLTERQRDVLRLAAQGMRNRQIGEMLGVAEKTVKMHRVALCKRLEVSTTGEAVRLAIEAGL
ncbi:response regulator transcription factor [Novosphingobium sp. 9U]|uniref:response regulator transcription factor n=1 Tax=Novosphingobium sp. 9U TaxID=2653158 RepID=UPI0012F21667|nr:LuxR C-terminal-related transcriptional regulator [Novosphingobium sp. 9U]VWX49375.1 Histidine kinase [Novosphingobium sp. 9U]